MRHECEGYEAEGVWMGTCEKMGWKVDGGQKVKVEVEGVEGKVFGG